MPYWSYVSQVGGKFSSSDQVVGIVGKCHLYATLVLYYVMDHFGYTLRMYFTLRQGWSDLKIDQRVVSVCRDPRANQFVNEMSHVDQIR